MIKLVKAIVIWGVMMWAVFAGPIITFDGEFKHKDVPNINGYRTVNVRLMGGYLSELNPGKEKWAETIQHVPIVEGFLSIELGHTQVIEPKAFQVSGAMFLVQIEGVEVKGLLHTFKVPLNYVPRAILSEFATKALEAFNVEAADIEGVVKEAQLVGAYNGISGLGVLDDDLIVKGVLTVNTESKRVGIRTGSPTHTLTVNGDIDVNGKIYFSDGTFLDSAQQILKIGGAIVTTGSVVIAADTDLNQTGDVEVRIGGKTHVVVKVKKENKKGQLTEGKAFMGIGVTEPRQTVEVNGAILIGDTSRNIEGSIRYQNNQFQGYDGKTWERLDRMNLEGGGWLLDPAKKVAFAEDTIRFGLGTFNPRGAIDAYGDIYAETFFGDLNGDGRGLTGLEMKNLEGVFSLKQGGTGAKLVGKNQFVGINALGTHLELIPELKEGELLIGRSNGLPIPGKILAGEGIQVKSESDKITIEHGPTSTQKSTQNGSDQYIQNIELDAFGHIQKIHVKTFDTVDMAAFLNKKGGEISGELEIHGGLIFSGEKAQIDSKNGEVIIDKDVLVGIGVQNPQYPLEIAGAIKIGNTIKAYPGVIRYDAEEDRFLGRNNQEWIYLDALKKESNGWVLLDNGKDIVNQDKKVGIGTNTPQEKLHVKGNIFNEGNVRVVGNLMPGGAIVMGASRIEKNQWIGTWDLSEATLNQLNTFKGNHIEADHITANQDVTIVRDIEIMNQIDLGATKISDGNIVGDLNMNQAILTEVKSLNAGKLTFKNNIITSNEKIHIDAKVDIQNAITISKDGIEGKMATGLDISSDAPIIIEGIKIHPNQNLTGIDNMRVEGTMTVKEDNLFQGMIEMSNGLLIDTNGYLGVRRKAEGDESVGIEGDLAVGHVTNVNSQKSTKSDVIVEGNLMVEGDFVKENSVNSLISKGSTVLSSQTSQLLVGVERTGSNAKMVVIAPQTNPVAIEWLNSHHNRLARMMTNGRFGIGNVDEPKGLIHIGAGTTEIPSMILNASPILTQPEPGAIEYNGTGLLLTTDSGVRSEVLDRHSNQQISNKTFMMPELNNVEIENPLVFNSSPINIQAAEGRSLIMSIDGKVGINIPTPTAKLHISGAIQVGEEQDTNTHGGIIRFKNERFQGYKANTNEWVNLDFELEDSEWRRDNGSAYAITRMGVGKSNLQAELDVNGRLKATKFVGDGTQLRNIVPDNFTSIIPIKKGGTGKKVFELSGVLIGTQAAGIETVNISGDGALLIGSGYKVPEATPLTAGSGVIIENGPGYISIQHTNTQGVGSVKLRDEEAVERINVDEFGHFLEVVTKNLDNRYYTKEKSDERYITKNGGTLIGTLYLNSSQAEIETSEYHPNLLIDPKGKLKIGEGQPLAFVDVEGSIRLGKGIGLAGEIQYQNGRFEGHNGVKWVKLDIDKGIDGSFEATGGFKGNGQQLTSIDPDQFNGAVAVSKGGTGRHQFMQGGLIIGSGENAIRTLPVLKNGEILIGDGDQDPSIAQMKSGGGISIIDGKGSITIHNLEPIGFNRQLIGTQQWGEFQALKSINLDQYGRVKDFTTKDLRTRYHTKQETDQLFVAKAGGELNGPLVINGVEKDMTSINGLNINIIAAEGNGIGIGKTDPDSKVGLDIEGGIKLSTKQNLRQFAARGTLLYEDSHFYGKTNEVLNNGWKKLDLDQNDAGVVQADKIITNDGSGIKKINLSSDNIADGVQLSVANGGTGKQVFQEGSVLVGDEDLNWIEVLLPERQSIIMKDYKTGFATAGYLKADNIGIELNPKANSNTLVVSHKDTSSIQNARLKETEVVSQLEFDTFGHVKSGKIKDLEDFFHNKTIESERFVNQNGDTLSGTLQFSTTSKDITTTQANPTLNIKLLNQGRMKIGMTDHNDRPKSILEVQGAITVGPKKHEFVPGMIFWDGSHYRGYNGQESVTLDIQLTDLGLKVTDTEVTYEKKVEIEVDSSSTIALQTTGVIEADSFRGNGSQLTGLDPNQFTDIIAVSSGGTGLTLTDYYNNSKNGDLLMYAGKMNVGGTEKHVLKTLTIEEGKTLMGKGSGSTSRLNNIQIKGTDDVIVNRVGTSLNVTLEDKISDYQLRSEDEELNQDYFMIDNLKLNTQGLITQIQRSPWTNTFYTKTQYDNQFLKQTSGTIMNSVTFNQLENEYNIKTPQNPDGSYQDFTINARYVGIGLTNPSAKLHVNGSMQMEPNSKSVSAMQNGTIFYDEATGILGKANDEVVRLSEKPPILLWKGNESKAYTSENKTQKVGIGITNPETLLHVNGGVYGNELIGNGSQLTKLAPGNFQQDKALTVSRGGTGLSSFIKDRVFAGNNNDPIQQIKLDDGEILIGKFNGTSVVPTGNQIIGENLISVKTTDYQKIDIDHYKTTIIDDFQEVGGSKFIVSANIDAYGHVKQLDYEDLATLADETGNIYSALISDTLATTYFLPKSGGKIYTPLKVNQQLDNYTMKSDEHISFDQNGRNIGIGMTNPTEKLTISGNIAMESTSPSLIFYDTYGNNAIKIESKDAALKFVKSGMTAMAVQLAGTTKSLVGMGLTNPTHRFHIKQGFQDKNAGLQLENLAGNQKWQLYYKNDEFVIGENSSAPNIVLSDANERVGIRKNTPESQLHILQLADSENGGLRIESVTGKKWNLFTKNNRFHMASDENSRVTLADQNNLGIGQTNPANRLHVKQIANNLNVETNNSGVKLSSFNGSEKVDFYYGSEMGGANIGINNTPMMTFLNNNNVGIGTTTPSTKLDVNGDVLATDLIAKSSLKTNKIVIRKANEADGVYFTESDNFLNGTSEKGFKMWVNTDGVNDRTFKMGWVLATNKANFDSNLYIEMDKEGDIGIRKTPVDNIALDVNGGAKITDDLVIGGIGTLTGTTMTQLTSSAVTVNQNLDAGTLTSRGTNQFASLTVQLAATQRPTMKNMTINSTSEFGSLDLSRVDVTINQLNTSNDDLIKGNTTIEGKLTAQSSATIMQNAEMKKALKTTGEMSINGGNVNVETNLRLNGKVGIGVQEYNDQWFPVYNALMIKSIASTVSTPSNAGLKIINSSNNSYFSVGVYDRGAVFEAKKGNAYLPLVFNPGAGPNDGGGVGIKTVYGGVDVTQKLKVMGTGKMASLYSSKIIDLDNPSYFLDAGNKTVLNGRIVDGVVVAGTFNSLSAYIVGTQHIADKGVGTDDLANDAITEHDILEDNNMIWEFDTVEVTEKLTVGHTGGKVLGSLDADTSSFSRHNGSATLWSNNGLKFVDINDSGVDSWDPSIDGDGDVKAGKMDFPSGSIYATPHSDKYILSNSGAGGVTIDWADTNTLRFHLSHAQHGNNKTLHLSWAGGWAFQSDRRLKKNIKKEDNILDRLMNLNVVRFNYKKEPNRLHVGFVAQEVKPLFPELISNKVGDDGETYLTLGYTSFSVLAIGGIQELKIEKDKELKQLKEEHKKKMISIQLEIEKIEKENNKIENDLNKIMNRI